MKLFNNWFHPPNSWLDFHLHREGSYSAIADVKICKFLCDILQPNDKNTWKSGAVKPQNNIKKKTVV